MRLETTRHPDESQDPEPSSATRRNPGSWVKPRMTARGGTPYPPPSPRQRSARYGSITVSITWISPFDWRTSAIVIRPLCPLPSMMPQPLPDFMNISGSPCTVV